MSRRLLLALRYRRYFHKKFEYLNISKFIFISVVECLSCPKGAYCPGGFDIKTDTGFWRMSNDSDVIIQL